jgi:hypothetical protein
MAPYGFLVGRNWGNSQFSASARSESGAKASDATFDEVYAYYTELIGAPFYEGINTSLGDARSAVWNVDLDGMIGAVSMVEPTPNGYRFLSVTSRSSARATGATQRHRQMP